MIDSETADKLRAALSMIQVAIYSESEVPEQTQEKLLSLISVKGFQLVDELEGVVR